MLQLTASRAFRAVLPVSAAVLCCAALAEQLPHPAPALEPEAPAVEVVEEPVAPARCPDLTIAKPAWLSSSSSAADAARIVAVPESMAVRVAFWERVWGALSEQQTLIVDKNAPWLVWAEADCRVVVADSADVRERACGEQVAIALRTARARLRTDNVDDDVARAYATPDERRAAADRLMGVRGRSEPLRRALRRARAELPTASAIFAAHGVPPALARAAIVESLWRPEAVSRAGAVGTFQFTESTGRVYLRIDDDVDERKDTARAAAAAATYLRTLHRSFGDWSLALTAYNTGPGRLKRVMAARGTKDTGALADAGSIMGFGFDGQNYAAQIAAVVAVTADEPLIARLDRTPVALTLTAPRSLSSAAACLETDPDEVLRANPALRGDRLPAGYVLRVPATVDGDARVARADLAEDGKDVLQ